MTTTRLSLFFFGQHLGDPVKARLGKIEVAAKRVLEKMRAGESFALYGRWCPPLRCIRLRR